jgi:hypothetical protein
MADNEVNSESSHIDVHKAEEEFYTLSRQLSNKSANTIRKSTDSYRDPELEKGLDENEELFNLREYLTSSNDANQRAGIRHKVVTKNLITWSLTNNMSSEHRGNLGELTGRGSRGMG